ncbi:MAG: sulfoxide reductase heme-binding subunit YedZ [Gammaproteobacteria bacterium]|nr:sulfoxide reductase heme-binding subunit YedZ [Gammaproteobacteria bacterium]
MDTVINSNKYSSSLYNPALIKPAVFILCLLPLMNLVWNGFNQGLGVNPAETIIRTLGDWALYILLFTLAVTPLRKIAGLTALIRVRRMLGLIMFFYASLHLLAYVWFDQYFDWNEIVKDIIKRPFITLGFATFILLIPLVLTSTNKMMKRLKRRWKTLHQMIYPISLMAVVHYFWMTRADFRQPVIIAIILSGLLAYRLFVYFKKQQSI